MTDEERYRAEKEIIKEAHDFIQVKRAPTARDYNNYNIGDLWLDSTPGVLDIYMLISKAGGTATWQNLLNFVGNGLIKDMSLKEAVEFLNGITPIDLVPKEDGH
jgi:hypothetical protein